MSTWNIGNISVTRVEEGLGLSSVGPEVFLTNFDSETFQSHHEWLSPIHYNPEANRLVSSIHSWVIRSKNQVILLDTCSGNHKNRPFNKRFHQLDTPYIARLRAAGVAPEEVDIVMCTHLHTDHCGWNTQLKDGRWIPTFPNAKYLFSKEENDRWKPKPGIDPVNEVYQDSVSPVIQAGQAVLLDGAHEIDTQLVTEPAPGHTIGHMILKAGGGDDRAVFCGDAVHHPIQIFEPTWNTKFCENQAQAFSTRMSILEYCVESQALLFPTHFAPPHVAGVYQRRGKFAPTFIPSIATTR
jgi:glyoxylase-like metal-dependent hydrolase (beta-lactamase superfamily II)